MRRPSHKKYLALSILLILASISFMRTTIEIFQSSKKLDATKGDIAELKDQKDQLEKSIDYKKSDGYVEKVARDDLNLVKPGERVFVVKDNNNTGSNPSSDPDPSNTLSATSERLTSKLTVTQRLHNLQKWWSVLF